MGLRTSNGSIVLQFKTQFPPLLPSVWINPGNFFTERQTGAYLDQQIFLSAWENTHHKDRVPDNGQWQFWTDLDKQWKSTFSVMACTNEFYPHRIRPYVILIHSVTGLPTADIMIMQRQQAQWLSAAYQSKTHSRHTTPRGRKLWKKH